MAEPLTPVTDEDVRAAWRAYFARENDALNELVPPLEPDDPLMTHLGVDITLRALRRVLENDRRRVAEQLTGATA